MQITVQDAASAHLSDSLVTQILRDLESTSTVFFTVLGIHVLITSQKCDIQPGGQENEHSCDWMPSQKMKRSEESLRPVLCQKKKIL
jgi:hypothetical protein